MSYTTVYEVYPDRVESLGSLSNGWLSAPLVWDALAKSRLGWEMWITKSPEEQQKLWDLSRDFRVPKAWRIVMSFTLDRSYVPVGRLEEAADACMVVHDELASKHRAGRTHWKAIAMSLRKTAVELSANPKPDLLGIGLACTSVSDPWRVYGRPSEDDEECGVVKDPEAVAFDAMAYADEPLAETLPVEG